ncbi:MAG: hypothetical protein WCC65_03130 [Pseudonocardiaceae bacterium]
MSMETMVRRMVAAGEAALRRRELIGSAIGGLPSSAAALAPRANNSYQARSPSAVRYPELPGANESSVRLPARPSGRGRR